MVQMHSRGMLLLNIKFQATCTSDIPNSLVKRMFDDSMTLHGAIRNSPSVTIYLPIYLSTYLSICPCIASYAYSVHKEDLIFFNIAGTGGE